MNTCQTILIFVLGAPLSNVICGIVLGKVGQWCSVCPAECVLHNVNALGLDGLFLFVFTHARGVVLMSTQLA